MSAHWKHTATRCAVEGCERQRVKMHSTCSLAAHYNLGALLNGPVRPIPMPADTVVPYAGVDDTLLAQWAAGGSFSAQTEVERRASERGIGGAL